MQNISDDLKCQNIGLYLFKELADICFLVHIRYLLRSYRHSPKISMLQFQSIVSAFNWFIYMFVSRKETQAQVCFFFFISIFCTCDDNEYIDTR